MKFALWVIRVKMYFRGGRALIPKNDFGWPILAGLFFARVGSFLLSLF